MSFLKIGVFIAQIITIYCFIKVLPRPKIKENKKIHFLFSSILYWLIFSAVNIVFIYLYSILK